MFTSTTYLALTLDFIFHFHYLPGTNILYFFSVHFKYLPGTFLSHYAETNLVLLTWPRYALFGTSVIYLTLSMIIFWYSLTLPTRRLFYLPKDLLLGLPTRYSLPFPWYLLYLHSTLLTWCSHTLLNYFVCLAYLPFKHFINLTATCFIYLALSSLV